MADGEYIPRGFGGGLRNYILVGRQPIPEPDLMKWLEFFATFNRALFVTHGALLKRGRPVCPVLVSTIFLGVDTAYGDSGPILFETMVFTCEDERAHLAQRRWRTYDDAERGHASVLRELIDMERPRVRVAYHREKKVLQFDSRLRRTILSGDGRLKRGSYLRFMEHLRNRYFRGRPLPSPAPASPASPPAE